MLTAGAGKSRARDQGTSDGAGTMAPVRRLLILGMMFGNSTSYYFLHKKELNNSKRSFSPFIWVEDYSILENWCSSLRNIHVFWFKNLLTDDGAKNI